LIEKVMPKVIVCAGRDRRTQGRSANPDRKNGVWNRRGTVNQHHDLKKAPTKVSKVMKKASKWRPTSMQNR
jgi:hypothetical protein